LLFDLSADIDKGQKLVRENALRATIFITAGGGALSISHFIP
jgi:hypothetical protein